MSRCLHLPIRILKVHIEALIGVSYIFNPNGFKNSYLKVVFLKQLLVGEWESGSTFQGQGKERRRGSQIAQVQLASQGVVIFS